MLEANSENSDIKKQNLQKLLSDPLQINYSIFPLNEVYLYRHKS